MAVGEASRGPRPPRDSGRSRAATPANAGERPELPTVTGGRGSRTGGFKGLFAFGSEPDDTREEEERQARAKEQVPDRGHVLDERDRDGDDVAQRAQVEQERRVEQRRDDHVDR